MLYAQQEGHVAKMPQFATGAGRRGGRRAARGAMRGSHGQARSVRVCMRVVKAVGEKGGEVVGQREKVGAGEVSGRRGSGGGRQRW